MSTLDQKRLLKLAGLLKEGIEEWPRHLEEAEEEEVPKARLGDLDEPMGYDVGEPEYKWEPSPDMSREHMESLYSDMYKELHNIRPRWVDFENISDSELRQMLVNLQDDIDNAPPLDDYEDYEDYEAEADREVEAFKQSLYMQGEEDQEFLEPEASAEEEELERMPKHIGMGRGASLDETIRAMVREVLLEKKEETASFLLEERQPYELLGKKNGQWQQITGFQSTSPKSALSRGLEWMIRNQIDTSQFAEIAVSFAGKIQKKISMQKAEKEMEKMASAGKKRAAKKED